MTVDYILRKTCTKCSLLKDLSEFGVDKKKKDVNVGFRVPWILGIIAAALGGVNTSSARYHPPLTFVNLLDV